ncbi:MAG: hypothetical protein Q8N05_17240 [Bacteroidota bacterium]|nr:hypothetical protein [Bacteroidota bacterium]
MKQLAFILLFFAYNLTMDGSGYLKHLKSPALAGMPPVTGYVPGCC